MVETNVLEIKNLSASWNGVKVLQNVSFALHSGEFVCLTGPNGGGKSTLLSLLAGIKDSGLTIDKADMYPSYNGVPLQKYGFHKKDNKAKYLSRKEVAVHISYLTQNETSAWNYKVRDVVLMGRYAHTDISGKYTEHDFEVVDSVLKKLQISTLADRNVFELSGGEFQKVRIARSLAQEPDMLLLDEPVANLDFGYQAELLAFIRDLAHEKNSNQKENQSCKVPGILVSIHDLNTAARFADTLVLLPHIATTSNYQSIVKGTPQEILTCEILQKIYGVAFGTFIHPEYGCVQVFTR